MAEVQVLGLLDRILQRIEELVAGVRAVYVSPYTGLRSIVLNVSPRNIPVLSSALHEVFRPRYPSRTVVSIGPGETHTVLEARPGWLYMVFVHLDDGGTGLGAFIALEAYVKKTRVGTYEKWPIVFGSIAWKELYGMDSTSPFKVDKDYVPGVRGLWNLLFKDPDGQEIPWEWKLTLRYPTREEIQVYRAEAQHRDKLDLVDLAANALDSYGRPVRVDYTVAYVEVDRDKLMRLLEVPRA